MNDNTRVTANPYNAKKEWDAPVAAQTGFMSADDALGSFSNAVVEDDDDVNIEDIATSREASEDSDDIATAREKQYKTPDWQKRYSDLRRMTQRKEVEWEEEKARILQEARSKNPNYVPPKTPEELATLREENPDMYDFVDSVAHMRAGEQITKLNEEIASLKKTQTKSAHAEAKAQLMKLHPDFNEITASADFHDWASSQPKQIQDWVYKNGTNAALASRAIDLFKKDQGIIEREQHATKDKDTKVGKQRKSEERANAAEAVSVAAKPEPKSSTARIWKSSEIARLSLAEYEKYEDDIQAANREGRIVKG